MLLLRNERDGNAQNSTAARAGKCDKVLAGKHGMSNSYHRSHLVPSSYFEPDAAAPSALFSDGKIPVCNIYTHTHTHTERQDV